jgi:hypothetical protein
MKSKDNHFLSLFKQACENGLIVGHKFNFIAYNVIRYDFKAKPTQLKPLSEKPCAIILVDFKAKKRVA